MKPGNSPTVSPFIIDIPNDSREVISIGSTRVFEYWLSFSRMCLRSFNMMISFVVIEFVLLEDLFITNLVIYQYIPFFFLFSILKITPINGKNHNISKFAVHIPNEEIKMEFRNIVEDNEKYSGVYNLISKSYDLLNDIWSLNSDAVAKVFDEAHQDHTSILTYNNENSLLCVISLSLVLSTTDTYNVIRELPTGKGYANLVYLPKPGVNKPALLIELKYDKSAQTAITQIKEKNYLQFFKDYKGEVLLVGINYSKDTKTHQCIIEKAQI